MTTAEKMVEIFLNDHDIILNGQVAIDHSAIKDITSEGTTVTFKTKKTNETMIVNFENVMTFLYKE